VLGGGGDGYFVFYLLFGWYRCDIVMFFTVFINLLFGMRWERQRADVLHQWEEQRIYFQVGVWFWQLHTSIYFLSNLPRYTFYQRPSKS
jgi:hypothetical protein